MRIPFHTPPTRIVESVSAQFKKKNINEMCIPFHTPPTRITQPVSLKLKKKNGRNRMCIPFHLQVHSYNEDDKIKQTTIPEINYKLKNIT